MSMIGRKIGLKFEGQAVNYIIGIILDKFESDGRTKYLVNRYLVSDDAYSVIEITTNQVGYIFHTDKEYDAYKMSLIRDYHIDMSITNVPSFGYLERELLKNCELIGIDSIPFLKLFYNIYSLKKHNDFDMNEQQIIDFKEGRITALKFSLYLDLFRCFDVKIDDEFKDKLIEIGLNKRYDNRLNNIQKWCINNEINPTQSKLIIQKFDDLWSRIYDGDDVNIELRNDLKPYENALLNGNISTMSIDDRTLFMTEIIETEIAYYTQFNNPNSSLTQYEK